MKEKVAKRKVAKWLFLKSKYGTRCAACNERYEIDDYVFVYTDGNTGYHPACAPQAAKDAEETKKFYAKYIGDNAND